MINQNHHYFIIRNAQESDINDLMHLAKQVFFINLPPDEEIISQKIKKSLRSFEKPSKNLDDNLYLFVLEDLNTNRVIGASIIHAQHGTPDEPHFYLKVDQEKKFSQTINTGFIHGTLKLGLETNGPTEIGGLVLDPEFRNHPAKLGKQISFARFLYIGLHPEHFKSVIHSELMPPYDSEGKSPLWEAIGRRFLNMDYFEADKLSRSNKEFILSLFPSEIIYQTLLPLDARDAIGKVGKDTEPVKRMLESIGFKYTHEVDPFDGGPHYRAKVKDIKPIQQLQKVQIKFKDLSDKDTQHFLISIKKTQSLFSALQLSGSLKKNVLTLHESIPAHIIKLIKDHTHVYCIPL